MSETPTPAEKETAMRDFLATIGAVAQAGIEHGQENTVALDLPEETIVRAGEIFRQNTAE
jgi:hypothetical protein